MQRQRGEWVPISEAFGGLGGSVKTIRDASPQARHHFTQADQVNQLVSASEADPDLGFMARMMALCSLPRTNPGNRIRYTRQNGPYTLYMDQRAYLNRMLRLALPFFRRRNIPRENASSNARYPGLAGYAIHAAPARSIWISRSLLTVTHFLGRTAAKSWVSPKTGAPAPPPPRPPSLPSPPPAGY